MLCWGPMVYLSLCAIQPLTPRFYQIVKIKIQFLIRTA